jgi:hypothetical protein
MTRPGVIITSRADTPPRSAPTQADMSFMIGNTEKGEAVELVTSMTAYESKVGKRAGNVDMYDAAEGYFRDGGAKLTVARANIGTPGDVAGALGVLDKALGPGQVEVPGVLGEDPDNHLLLLAHGAENNRVALLHGEADATAAELEALAATYRANANARYGALFAPAAIVPGLTSADTRTVAYDALAAGIMARNDRLHGVNDPAAGAHGRSAFAIDLTSAFTDAERESLNDAGVNVARSIYGQVQTYGYRTLADPETGWGLLSNARLNMEITAKLEAVAEMYVFAQIDGRGAKISQFGSDLVAVCIPYYESGALFGETAPDAFYVDVGPSVNPVESLAQGILRAVVGVRMSPFAELVVIEVVKVAIDQPLTALAA